MILITAIVTITLALVFYTFGVFSERRASVLNKKHVIVFWIGICFDTTGTLLMRNMANAGEKISASSTMSIHGITGVLAIVLMLFHAIWATTTYLSDNEKRKANFHKFSLFVWLFWLVPYIIGMIYGMA